MIKGIVLKPGERVIHVERGSLMPRIPMIVLGVFLIMLPFFFFFPLLSFGPAGTLLLLIIAGVGAIIILRLTIQWRGTMCILTTKRIIHVTQPGMLERRVSEASLKTIHDVAYKTEGLFGKIVRLGTVRLVFRGVVPNMLLQGVRHPARLHKLINELKDMPAVRLKQKAASFERLHMEDLEK